MCEDLTAVLDRERLSEEGKGERGVVEPISPNNARDHRGSKLGRSGRGRDNKRNLKLGAELAQQEANDGRSPHILWLAQSFHAELDLLLAPEARREKVPNDLHASWRREVRNERSVEIVIGLAAQRLLMKGRKKLLRSRMSRTWPGPMLKNSRTVLRTRVDRSASR